jgi:hypothetical protein
MFWFPPSGAAPSTKSMFRAAAFDDGLSLTRCGYSTCVTRSGTSHARVSRQQSCIPSTRLGPHLRGWALPHPRSSARVFANGVLQGIVRLAVTGRQALGGAS